MIRPNPKPWGIFIDDYNVYADIPRWVSITFYLWLSARYLLIYGQKLVSLTFPRSFVMAWGVTWFNVWSESCAVNLFKSLPAIHCPVYFFAGEKDYQTNYSITQEYFNKVSAPKKDLFLFAGSGHTLPETDPALFQDIIIDKILPETFKP